LSGKADVSKRRHVDSESNTGKEGAPELPALFCGVDVGASATKVVLIGKEGAILAKHVRKSGVDYKASARTALDNALDALGARESSVTRCVATGYGRSNVEFAARSVTEITCHGHGCYFYFPGRAVIVDIGGQDSKIIQIAGDGRRLGFKMNRKCAAGTGAFLEEIAARLEIPLEKLDSLARAADRKFTLGSFCTVFAKTEILAYIRRGERVENIIRGAFQSVVNRIVEMDRFTEGDVILTGGVVQHNAILVEALAESLGKEVLVPPDPQFTGALGAALTARDDDLPEDR